jgi:sugar phosphate isomerase/epimerase
MTRRDFLATAAVSSLAASSYTAAAASPGLRRRMRVALTPGSIGVGARSQAELNVLAQRHGFEAVEPMTSELAAMSPDALARTLADLKAKGLVWAAAGLPVDFRGDEPVFREGLARLGSLAAALKRAGVTRVGTWLLPSHRALTYRANFQRHADRLREVARVLGEHGLRLGLEYVGTRLLLVANRYPFVHTMAETRELIDAIGTGNVGLVLDTWHWWQAGDTEADIAALRPEEVVSVDLNDAPRGLEKALQKDNERELPLATGVIDAAAFLNALNRIGYDGPVRPEPFNRVVNEMDDDAACAAASGALHRAMELIRPA